MEGDVNNEFERVLLAAVVNWFKEPFCDICLQGLGRTRNLSQAGIGSKDLPITKKECYPLNRDVRYTVC
jgi:hypothetical protein